MALKDTWGKFKKRPDPLTSIALTIPVFLLYHLGILVAETRSDSDFVSNTVFGTLRASAPVYVVVTIALALLVATLTWIEERRGVSQPVSLGKVIVEGLIFAVVAVLVLAFLTSSVIRYAADPHGLHELNWFDKLVLAAGTGFHDEFIFRALLVTGLSWLLAKIFRMSTNAALWVSVVVSSIAFALVHYIGPRGMPFVGDVAAYRVLLGVLFAGLYIARGFAVAVYAHVFLEVLIYFLYT